MKHIFGVVLLSLLFIDGFCQEPGIAPVDPEFTEYMQSGYLKKSSVAGQPMGYIPPPMRFITSTDLLKTSAELPVYFDLRVVDGGAFLSPVTDQGACGSCWSFASMGSLESSFLLQGQGLMDLSENHLKQNHGFLNEPCAGGNSSIATAYFVRGSGPVNEADDPYYDGDRDNYNGNPAVRYITGAKFFSRDQQSVKNALLDYGALYVNMHYDNEYYNSVDYTYYNDSNTRANHAVILVGWDDNMPTAGGIGAWIIKNTWGTYWGQNGFFYIAYQDLSINSTVTAWPTSIDYTGATSIRGYDENGMIGWHGYGYSQAYAIVKFDFPGKQKLKSIGTYVIESGSTIGIEVYGSFNGVTLSNMKTSSSPQTIEHAGYVTIDLPHILNVDAGTSLFVKVQYNTPEYPYPVPVEMALDGYCTPEIERGVFWVSPDGLNWSARGQGTSFLIDPCVKIITENEVVSLSSFSAVPTGMHKIGINWEDSDNRDVLILWSEDNRFGTPLAGSQYVEGDVLENGGIVLFAGNDDEVIHTGLNPGSEYYFKLFSYVPGKGYCNGIVKKTTTFEAAMFEMPLELTAEVDDDFNVLLTWEAPFQKVFSINDSFEDYEDFSMAFGDWIQYDGDGYNTYGFTGIDYPNKHAKGSYIVFNPGATEPALSGSFWEAATGDKFLACFNSASGPNNDWLISPVITPGENYFLSFWARSFSDHKGLEKFKVGISTSGSDPSDFQVITSGEYVEAPTAWTQYYYDLSAYEGQDIRFAIICVSQDIALFMLDEILVTNYKESDRPDMSPMRNSISHPTVELHFPSDGELLPGFGDVFSGNVEKTAQSLQPAEAVLIGYGVYRNDALIVFNSGADNRTYIDEDAPKGKQVYRITALYDIPEGESLSSNSVELQIRKPGEVYLLTIEVEGGGITTPPAGEYYIKEGDPVEILALPEEGFEFADWKMDEIIMTSERAFSFNMPMFDVKITSHFNVITSTNPGKVNSLVVFPIPFDNELSVVSDNIITRIEVLSMSGHLISAFSPGQKSELKLNLGFLPQGIYILKIIDIGNSETIRRISKK